MNWNKSSIELEQFIKQTGTIRRTRRNKLDRHAHRCEVLHWSSARRAMDREGAVLHGEGPPPTRAAPCRPPSATGEARRGERRPAAGRGGERGLAGSGVRARARRGAGGSGGRPGRSSPGRKAQGGCRGGGGRGSAEVLLTGQLRIRFPGEWVG